MKNKLIKNDPRRAGQLAGKKLFFGGYSRFAIAPVHTRFDCVQWFVWDAETPDFETGKPSVIRQSDCMENAMDGLV